jgi:hypothetical protein
VISESVASSEMGLLDDESFMGGAWLEKGLTDIQTCCTDPALFPLMKVELLVLELEVQVVDEIV